MTYVTGAFDGRYLLSERLIAAIENVRLAPHWWHRVAVEPTSVPHAGHKRGRRCCSRGRKADDTLSRHLSIFQRQRSGSGNGFLAVTLPRSYNTQNPPNLTVRGGELKITRLAYGIYAETPKA